MSEFVNVPVGKQVESMDVSPQFDAYSGVEIIVDDDTSFFAGNRTGLVLSIQNAWGTQAQAQNILNSLTSTGFQYQPYSAEKALLNPAAEIGDAVTINGVYSGIYKLSKRYTPLTDSDIEAPQDEEVDHEYPFEPKQDRVFKRELAQASAQITLTQSQITAEVTRATQAEGSLSTRITQTANSITSEVTRAKSAEGTLSSRITQNATSINAKVSKTGGNNSSFGWSLLSNKFSLFSGNKEVFKCTSSGVEIQGKITSTSGQIGGFTIGSSALYNGMSSLSSSANGVYVGTDGISVGGGKFKVTSSGAVSAANMTLTGTLKIGGSTITADALRSGAQSAYNNGSYWSGGASGGYQASNAFNNGTQVTYLKATYLTCTSSYMYLGGSSASWRHATLKTANDTQLTIYWLGQGGTAGGPY